MSKYVVAGGTHTRTEKGETVTYAAGQEIKVTEEERKAFPGKFKLVETPRDASDEAKAQQLEVEVSQLKTQKSTLEANLKKAEGEVKALRADLKKAEETNADLKKQLDTAKK